MSVLKMLTRILTSLFRRIQIQKLTYGKYRFIENPLKNSTFKMSTGQYISTLLYRRMFCSENFAQRYLDRVFSVTSTISILFSSSSMTTAFFCLSLNIWQTVDEEHITFSGRRCSRIIKLTNDDFPALVSPKIIQISR